jgi:hypothetical protein
VNFATGRFLLILHLTPPLSPDWFSFDHVLGDVRLRDFKPELEQFAVDAWRAPKGIFDAHPPDQSAQFRADQRSLCLSEIKLAHTDDEVRREMA